MKRTFLALGASLLLPFAALAATYHYVDTTGTVRTVTASSADEAMMLSAGDRASNSGITLDTGVLDSGDTVTGSANTTAGTSVNYPDNSYQYVTVSGDIGVVVAASASQALTVAPDISDHSGVLDVDAAAKPIPASTDVSNPNAGAM